MKKIFLTAFAVLTMVNASNAQDIIYIMKYGTVSAQFNLATEVDRIVLYEPSFDELVRGTFTDDRDGTKYKWVKIGTQIWRAENLRATTYNDLTPIPTGYSDAGWTAISSGAYAVYPYGSIDGLNSEAEVLQAYGALYNWYAVETDKLCPTGWHVPNQTDWNTLINFAGGQYVAGGRLASTRKASDSHPYWFNNPDATDNYRFSALPAGSRNNYGFNGICYNCNFWSSTEVSSKGGLVSIISKAALWGSDSKVFGYPVRCVKD